MNLIRNTLIAVVFLQLLGFLYVKIFHSEDKKKSDIKQSISDKPMSIVNTKHIDNIVQVAINNVLSQTEKSLPLSKEYTDNQKVALQKIVKPIQKVYVKVQKKVKLSTKLEKYAKRMLGKKYVWGATGPKTYDCSGFTQKVYRTVAGIKLPRVSYLQAKVGKRISFKQLKQGDMVFFDTEKKRTGRVNHVGIYLKHGNFIHASSGGKKVMITNFRKKRFYKNRFLWGQRVIKEQRNIAMNSIGNKTSL
jgi:cell wall-associated NlpC family hydrolase